jgi:hypothetical protein
VASNRLHAFQHQQIVKNHPSDVERSLRTSTVDNLARRRQAVGTRNIRHDLGCSRGLTTE